MTTALSVPLRFVKGEKHHYVILARNRAKYLSGVLYRTLTFADNDIELYSACRNNVCSIVIILVTAELKEMTENLVECKCPSINFVLIMNRAPIFSNKWLHKMFKFDPDVWADPTYIVPNLTFANMLDFYARGFDIRELLSNMIKVDSAKVLKISRIADDQAEKYRISDAEFADCRNAAARSIMVGRLLAKSSAGRIDLIKLLSDLRQTGLLAT